MNNSCYSDSKLYEKGIVSYKDKIFDEKSFKKIEESILEKTEEGSLSIIFDDHSLGTVLSIIGCYRAKRSFILIDASSVNTLQNNIINNFDVNNLIGSKSFLESSGYSLDSVNQYLGIVKINSIGEEEKIIRNPIILLATSGSSGNPKMVVLTFDNLLNNCRSILKYLDMDESTRSINSLPCSYSYGLSILNTTLYSGGLYFCSDQTSYIRDQFWRNLSSYKINNFNGVPTTYRDIIRLGLLDRLPKSIDFITQAGGKLENELQQILLNWSRERGIKLFIMYGQTEATARLTFLELTKESNKLGSVGRPIPGVRLISSTRDSSILSSEELIFKGNNISMGYAYNRSDLTILKDMNHGILKTGDIGYQDIDNCIYINGRISRFTKIDGRRFSLEDIEQSLRSQGFDLYVISDDEFVYILSEHKIYEDQSNILSSIKSQTGIRKAKIKFIKTKIIINNNGKINYKAISDIVFTNNCHD
tara:strand:- start:1306 stop:2733 length:1428 start_codon:yes stop_codon:yes gene_type:complete